MMTTGSHSGETTTRYGGKTAVRLLKILCTRCSQLIIRYCTATSLADVFSWQQSTLTQQHISSSHQQHIYTVLIQSKSGYSTATGYSTSVESKSVHSVSGKNITRLFMKHAASHHSTRVPTRYYRRIHCGSRKWLPVTPRRGCCLHLRARRTLRSGSG